MLKFKIISLLIVICMMSCASGQQASYKPKYKKLNPDKPIPCPMKDC